MRVKEISVGLTGTISLDNYQNKKPSYSYIIELLKGDDEEAILDEYSKKLRDRFEAEENIAKIDKIQKEYENIRFYDNGSTKYPSVTSILGWDIDWSITEDELMQYASRGTIVHKLIEYYLKDGKWLNPIDLPELTNEVKILATGSKKLSWQDCSYKVAIEKIVKDLEITDIEKTVFNDELLYAGTADLVGKYRGKRSVIDFKTGNTTDMRQLSAYAVCLEKVEQLIIVPVGCTKNACGYKNPIVNTDIEKNYRDFKKARTKFRQRFGI